MARNPNNRLERWEVAIIKTMMATPPRKPDQDILAYFTRPSRSINHGRIKDIRDGKTHAAVAPATADELSAFLKAWPNADDRGLHLIGDELLIKAREAMLQAVQGFNNPRALFKSEIFIVTAVIAWTYLMHSHFKRLGVDYRYRDRRTNEILKTRHGADKYWELQYCLENKNCPLDVAMRCFWNMALMQRSMSEITRVQIRKTAPKIVVRCLRRRRANLLRPRINRSRPKTVDRARPYSHSIVPGGFDVTSQDHAVDALDLVDDAGCGLAQNFHVEGIEVGVIPSVERAKAHNIFIRATVIHHAEG
jgi:hypothetical protein